MFSLQQCTITQTVEKHHSSSKNSHVWLSLDQWSIVDKKKLCRWLPSVLWRCWLGSTKGIRPV